MGLGVVPFGIVWSIPRRLQAVGKYGVQAGIAGALLGLDIVLKIRLTTLLFGSVGVPLSTVIAYAIVAALYFGYLSIRRLLVVPRWGWKWVAVVCGTSVVVTLRFSIRQWTRGFMVGSVRLFRFHLGIHAAGALERDAERTHAGIWKGRSSWRARHTWFWADSYPRNGRTYGKDNKSGLLAWRDMATCCIWSEPPQVGCPPDEC